MPTHATRQIALLSLIGLALGGRADAARPHPGTTGVAVGPQYDSTHVYVPAADLDAFVASFIATFDGQASKPVVSTVTPTASSTVFQYVRSPVGLLSIFAYRTPVPYPFGQERTGYLVANMDQAIRAARSAGASVIVEPFKDPIGMDAIIEWPGGVKMQMYWHFTPPSNPPLTSVPENRVYVPPDRIDNFVHAFIDFSHGKVTSDDREANAAELGQPGKSYRRVRLESPFGKMQIMATDGQLPYPFGYDIAGYEVPDLDETLARARDHDVKVLVAPVETAERRSAVVQFPGGFIAEIHSWR